MAFDNLEIVKEFAQILRGQHPAYDLRGDKIANAASFLRQIRNDFPEEARALAYDIECNLEAYSQETNLPERRLITVQKVLYGQWSDL